MSRTKSGVATAVSLIGLMLASQAHAESGGNDQEIALLRQQLRLLEQKLDKLQKQTSANTTAAANANAKVDATAKVANANAAIPVKGPVAPSGAIVTMPGNRPTICTDDGLNCVAITGRIHLDGGGYDYHPNTAATVPQRLDNGVNARRARINTGASILARNATQGKDWNLLPTSFAQSPKACSAGLRLVLLFEDGSEYSEVRAVTGGTCYVSCRMTRNTDQGRTSFTSPNLSRFRWGNIVGAQMHSVSAASDGNVAS